MTGLWLSTTNNICSVGWLSYSVLKPVSKPVFKLIKKQIPASQLWYGSTFLTECCLFAWRDRDSDHTVNGCFKNSRVVVGGRRAISESLRSHVCVRMCGCLAKTPPKLTATACWQSITVWMGTVGKIKKKQIKSESRRNPPGELWHCN